MPLTPDQSRFQSFEERSGNLRSSAGFGPSPTFTTFEQADDRLHAQYANVRGEQLQANARAIVRRREPRTLATLEPRGAYATPVGIARPSGTQAGLGGGGIASPLSEGTVGDRTYWSTPILISSSDGLFILEFLPIQNVDFTDAGGSAVRIIYANPSA